MIPFPHHLFSPDERLECSCVEGEGKANSSSFSVSQTFQLVVRIDVTWFSS